MPQLPSITLVTPSLNGGAFLRAALESVRRQADPALEHLIVDAHSTDETHAIAAEFPEATLIIERSDSHQAMNAGVRRAKGEIIGFLNTDDALADGALARVREAFAADASADAVQGGAAFLDINTPGAPHCLHVLRAPASEDLTSALIYLATGFNAWFFRREAIKRLGGFDTGYSYSADRDFLIRCAAGQRVLALSHVIYGYRMHPSSRTMGGDAATIAGWLREHLRLAMRLKMEANNDAALHLASRFEAFERARLALYRARAGAPMSGIGELTGYVLSDPLWGWRFAGALSERARLYRLYLDRAPTLDAKARFPSL